jgi:hypothetical protein
VRTFRWPGIASSIARVMLAVLASSAAGNARAAGPPALPDIKGIYVVVQNALLVDAALTQQLKQAIALPGVDGILVDLRWSPDTASATTKGGEDWTLLDQAVQLAAAAGKKFEIAIITGGSSPSWVFEDPPQGFGAASGYFDFIQGDKPGAQCLPETVAPPWNRQYLTAFGGFLADLSDHLKAAGTYPSLTMLRMTGINTLTDELRLPGQSAESTGGAYDCPVDNLKQWQDLGYRPSKVVSAWRQMLNIYKREFPDKVFNVALITGNAFPAFLPDGTPVLTPVSQVAKLSAKTTSQLVAAAGQKLPGQLVVQSNGLVDQPPDPTTIELAQAAHAMLAWQTNEWEALQGGAACGGSREQPQPCDASSFYAMLQQGTFPHGTTGQSPLKAQYLELFVPNVIAFPDDVLQAHNLLVQ